LVRRCGFQFMTPSTSPEPCDIIVGKEKRDGAHVYVLRTASGSDQYLLRTRDEAVEQAVTFARRQCVRAWFTDDGHDAVLLEDSRQVERWSNVR
jgi:hypothetical protein